MIPKTGKSGLVLNNVADECNCILYAQTDSAKDQKRLQSIEIFVNHLVIRLEAGYRMLSGGWMVLNALPDKGGWQLHHPPEFSYTCSICYLNRMIAFCAVIQIPQPSGTQTAIQASATSQE